MAQASASTCKAADDDTLSIVTTEYSKGRLSEQSSRESQHQAQAEDDEGFFSCVRWLRPFTSFFSDAAPEKQSGRSDRFDRLSWKGAGSTQPGVVNSPTDDLDQNTHPHTRDSCEESFSNSCPDRAKIYKCPRIAADEEKPDLYIKDTRHDSSIDSSIDPETQGLSLTSKRLAKETTQVWDICVRQALHPDQSKEDTLSLIRNLAAQALKTPRTATIHASTFSVPTHCVDDSQLASSVDRPVTVNLVEPPEDFDHWTFGSQCKSGQTFNSKDGCIEVTTQIIVGKIAPECQECCQEWYEDQNS